MPMNSDASILVDARPRTQPSTLDDALWPSGSGGTALEFLSGHGIFVQANLCGHPARLWPLSNADAYKVASARRRLQFRPTSRRTAEHGPACRQRNHLVVDP